VGLLVSLGAWVAFVARAGRCRTLLLLGWLGTELLGDVIYGRTGATGAFEYGQYWQVLYVLSAACLGALALHPDLRSLAAPSERPAGHGRGRLLALGAAAAAPVGTLLYAELAGQHHETVVLLCIATTFVLIALICLRVSSLLADLAEQRLLLDELERMSSDLNHRVLHDPLTGLGNRTMFRDRLQVALSQRAVAADRSAAGAAARPGRLQGGQRQPGSRRRRPRAGRGRAPAQGDGAARGRRSAAWAATSSRSCCRR
jgi:hypothetical protein